MKDKIMRYTENKEKEKKISAYIQHFSQLFCYLIISIKLNYYNFFHQ